MLGLLLALLIAPQERAFDDERLLLDRRLETLRRVLPDGHDIRADAAHVSELARRAGLLSPDVLARPPADATGSDRGFVELDVAAFAPYPDVDRFFREVALSHRLVDVAELSLSPTPNEMVQLKAVLRLPYRPVRAPLPAPPEGWNDTLRGVSRPIHDAFLRDQALALARSQTIAALRRDRRNPRLFLSELAAITRDRPVALTHAELGDAFRVRGRTVGDGPARDLTTRFEEGFFRIDEMGFVREGACLRFEVRGRCPFVGREAVLPLPADDPFAQDEAACRVDRDTSATSALRLPGNGKPGKGPITLRLRDVDLTDVVFALQRLTAESFVVDGELAGRTSVDLLGVSLDEALKGLAELGLRVSEAGGIRRVAPRSASVRTWPLVSEGPAASYSVKRASVRELLASMSLAEPGLAGFGPSGHLGSVSVWAENVPLLDLRAAMLDAVALVEEFEDGQRLLRRPLGDQEELAPLTAEAPSRRLVLAAEQLTPMEFELAGVGSAGQGFVAFAYGPSGVLHVYAPGASLADASVVGVNATDVLLETEEGPLRIPLAPID